VTVVLPAPATSRPAQRKWSREAIVRALRERARDGVAPSSSSWKRSGAGRPRTKQVTAEFGSWEAAVKASGLVTPWQRARERRAAGLAPGDTLAPGETVEDARERRDRERGEEKVRTLLEEEATGDLVVRQATAADLASLDAAKARRLQAWQPTPAREELGLMPFDAGQPVGAVAG